MPILIQPVYNRDSYLVNTNIEHTIQMENEEVRLRAHFETLNVYVKAII